MPDLRRREEDSTFLVPPITQIVRPASLPAPAFPPPCVPISTVSPGYPSSSETVPEVYAEMIATTSKATPFWPRPRGEDGRFMPARSGNGTSPEASGKTCGWCLAHETSQWRLGSICVAPDSPMRVLCNACGINFRRAAAKRSPCEGPIDLDVLARAMGPARPSIQKALKRARWSRMMGGKQELSGDNSRRPHLPRPNMLLGLEPLRTVASTSNEDLKSDAVSKCVQIRRTQVPALPSIGMLLKSIGETEIPLFESDFAEKEKENRSRTKHGLRYC